MKLTSWKRVVFGALFVLGMAAPVAGTAHAGGLAGGVVAGGGSATGSSSVGTRPDVTPGTGPIVQPFASRPSSGGEF